MDKIIRPEKFETNLRDTNRADIIDSLRDEKQSATSWWVVLIFMILQACFVIGLKADFLTDWDSYLYTIGGIRFEPIGLAGGRWGFTGALHVAWRAVNAVTSVGVNDAWFIFSWLMIAFSIFNVWLFFKLAIYWCGKNGGIIATGIFVSSPLIGLYGSAVMSETMAISAMLFCLLILSKRSDSIWRIVLAGLIFGFGIAIREPILLLCFIPVGLICFGNRESKSGWFVTIIKMIIFVLAMSAVVIANLFLVWNANENWQSIYESWSMGMSRERTAMGHTAWKMILRNVICLIFWIAIFSPMVLLTIVGQIKLVYANRLRWLTALAIGVIAYAIGEVANHSLVFNPRFVIFMGTLMSMPAGLVIWRWLGSRMKNPYLIAGLIIAINGMAISMLWDGFDNYYFAKSQAAKEVFETLDDVDSDDALFAGGKLTPVIEFYRQLNGNEWQIIYAGWDFSDKELCEAVEKAKKSGRTVYLVEETYWAQKPFRSAQYISMQSIWENYEHRTSEVAHFHKLIFPKKSKPAGIIHSAFEFLMS